MFMRVVVGGWRLAAAAGGGGGSRGLAMGGERKKKKAWCFYLIKNDSKQHQITRLSFISPQISFG